MNHQAHTKTLKVRIRDKHAKVLRAWAFSVNQVWNYCNELSHRHITERQTWLSGYDLQDYTKGSAKELGLNSATVQMVGHEYVTRRKQFKKSRLSWRKSGGARRSLGWIPVRKDCISFKNGQIYHNRHYFKIWDSYGLGQYTFRAGSFSEDALHKFSRELVNRCGEIYVGNVKPSLLTQTKMAKSILDAGWAMLKTMLEYKCAHAGIVFKAVDESYTTQTCSSCGALPDSRPRGITGLGIRAWTCSACGVTHDCRDVNAARNILAVGHGRPEEGIPRYNQLV